MTSFLGTMQETIQYLYQKKLVSQLFREINHAIWEFLLYCVANCKISKFQNFNQN
jgi:hypothetical protein